VNDGVAIGVYDKDQLVPAIRMLLTDDSVLAIHRDTYIKKYLYKIDGKATERVVGVIQEMQRNNVI
jgi:hypothetical protein